MKKRLLEIFQKNKLLKVTSQNSAGILVKLFTGLATSKIVAYFFGRSGMALLGNLKNFQSVVNSLSIGGLEKGAIRYSAEYKDDSKRLKSFVSTLLVIGISICFLLGIILFIGSSFFNQLIFPTKNFDYVFKLLAIILPLHMLNVYCLSILKGLGEFKKVIFINVFSNIINLALMGLLVWQYGFEGAILTVVILPSAILIITLIVANKKLDVIRNFRFINISRIFSKNLSHYALMTLISSVTFPIIFLLVRNFIIAEVGIDEAGYWEALNRISNYYLLFVMSLLSLYILPELAAAKTDDGFKAIIFNFYKTILPFFGIGLILIYIFRYWIVKVIYSEEFLPMISLFKWQLIGDFIRVSVIVITHQLHAKKMIWKFILSDMFLAATTYLSSVIFIKQLGLEGVTIAHTVTWFLYGLVILFIFRKTFLSKWIT
ncbi:O-antigen translocase [Mesonia aquimarina]|uniref:O-antigen translocase n=1 Tax=Mesonia aquimarina TaxID=1504967 RepID=UPI000EF606B2|nr:O-antigen translocase [Mesonia aquimarina]